MELELVMQHDVACSDMEMPQISGFFVSTLENYGSISPTVLMVV